MVSSGKVADFVITAWVVGSLGIMAVIVAVALSVSLTRPKPPGPSPKPMMDYVGVSTHTIAPMQGEFDLLTAEGFKVVRTDIPWIDIETKKGSYDFSKYDNYIFNEIVPRNITALMILDYSNPFYDDNFSPYTDAGRKGFFKLRDGLCRKIQRAWYHVGDPNLDTFWRPTVNVDDFNKLALLVTSSIKAKYPREYIIGPCTSKIDLPFLEDTFKADRTIYPESANGEFTALRALIDKYTPPGRSQIPVVVSEWGYSQLYPGIGALIQAKFAPRLLLTCIYNNVSKTIYYEWQNHCTDNKDSECFFGTVGNAYYSLRDPVFNLELAYNNIKTLTTLLRYKTYLGNKVQTNNDYCMLFSNGDLPSTTYACWTSDIVPKTGIINNATVGTCYDVINVIGRNISSVCADEMGSISTSLTDSVTYLVIRK
ncbi:N-acetylglucosamine transferase [Acrasis kona]|uniref:N-acetylglucosamine transferase n=1 Tax=Acrasis kona TaxID=1008807 RepID=A0AAW2YNA1_9EUKA